MLSMEMYLVICNYVEKSGHSKNHEKSEGLATIIRRERMMNRRTERMEMRITMKAKEGWGRVLLPYSYLQTMTICFEGGHNMT